jgi:hypothetical protein
VNVSTNRHLGAAPARDQRDERADGAAAEDHDAIATLDRRAIHVVRRHRERLEHRRLIVAQRVGHVEHLAHRHRPVLLHPAGHVDATHLQLLAEVGGAHAARTTAPARHHGIDHHAITGLEATGRRRFHDLGERLVPDHAALRHAVIEVALEDVEVAQERLVAPRLRHGRVDGGEAAGAAVRGCSHGEDLSAFF